MLRLPCYPELNMKPITRLNTDRPAKKTPYVVGKKTKHRSKSALIVLATSFFGLGSLFTWSNANAFEELNEPQTLIYDTNHLEKTSAGNLISYDYSYINTSNDEKVEDQVLLSITKEHVDAKRNMSISFLSDERKLHLPDFNNRRGNPVIIGMLEHLAQTMGQETGGGALYFRNRIKDKLADDSLKIVQSGSKSEFSFSPFTNDPYVADRISLTESVITIAFSNDVPGQLLSIEYVSGPSKKPESTRKLVFSGLQAQ